MTAGFMYPKIIISIMTQSKSRVEIDPVKEYRVVLKIVCGLLFSVKSSMLKSRLVSLV